MSSFVSAKDWDIFPVGMVLQSCRSSKNEVLVDSRQLFLLCFTDPVLYPAFLPTGTSRELQWQGGGTLFVQWKAWGRGVLLWFLTNRQHTRSFNCYFLRWMSVGGVGVRWAEFLLLLSHPWISPLLSKASCASYPAMTLCFSSSSWAVHLWTTYVITSVFPTLIQHDSSGCHWPHTWKWRSGCVGSPSTWVYFACWRDSNFFRCSVES